MTTAVEHVVCPNCGCLCDDLIIEVDSSRVTRAGRACSNGRAFFQNYDPSARLPAIRGKPVDWDSALSEAAAILSHSHSPLIYGLSSTSTEAQRCAVEIADRLGACIDSTSSICHGPAVLAMQSVGLPCCTLGEIRNDADLLIFWGCNPAVSHPRFLARYAPPTAANSSRRRVVVDVRPTATSRIADLFLQVATGADYEVLTALRFMVRGKPIRCNSVGGLPAAQLSELAANMKACRFGVILVGVGLTMSRGRDLNLSELFALVAELNEYTRFSVLPMRGHGNVAGADQVLTWQTGYPFAVSLARGWPEYGPGEFSASDLLARHETDAALIIASDPVAHLPAAAGEWVRQIPVIAIDPNPNLTTSTARVVLPTACCGIDAGGTYYRMDGVPIRLRPVLEAARPTDEQVLRQLLALLGPTSPTAVPAC